MKTIINRIFKNINFKLVSKKQLEYYKTSASRAKDDLYFLNELPDDAALFYLRNLEKSRSQLRQDLFVLVQLGFKRNGFFVEFGATNGVSLSNTYLLEKDYGWHGILVEPVRSWYSELKKNRAARIDNRCVWRLSDKELEFTEATTPELSTLTKFVTADLHSNARIPRVIYSVKTVTLGDLLIDHNAPRNIDYLSIDTEGSEYEILSSFDFKNTSFNVITVEHNYTPARQKLYKLLTENGYRRVMQEISQFDDWYVAR